MYERRFGLEKNPFLMTPDPGFLFLTNMHREALSGLGYAILQNKGFVVLTGDAGTGKTTLLSRLLRHMPENRVRFSLVLNPTLTPQEFLEAALWDFGITDVPESKVQRLLRLQQYVTEVQAQGHSCVLVVDEAHKLSAEVLEEIRLLTNFETADRKLLQIVLVGQQELKDLLGRDDLRQLKQRIAARFELKPLAKEEVDDYIRFRWTKAGGEFFPFSKEAIDAIGMYSRGVPRVINSICDNALLLVFATEADMMTIDHVREVISDLDLGAPPVKSKAAAVNGSGEMLKLELPKPVQSPPPMRPLRLSSLEQYIPPAPKPPRWLRWAERLGWIAMEKKSL
jgi:general secretion pathway protein A